jgi:hypothetical protein
LVAIIIGHSKFSGRFLKNINFPPPPHLPPVFIYIVFDLEDLGDCGFCSQNVIYSRRYFKSSLKLAYYYESKSIAFRVETDNYYSPVENTE